MNEIDFKMAGKTGEGADTKAPRSVRVEAPGRLHLGLLDLAGDLGRRFGSIGLALDQPRLRLTASLSDRLSVEAEDAIRIERYVHKVIDLLGLPEGLGNQVRIVIEEELPSHAGFGSGTQMALSVGAALAALGGVPFDAPRLAAGLDRGARSGIGLTAFLKGGFVVDGGRGPRSVVPPTISRLPFPEDWRVILVLDDSIVGVHGPQEAEAFRQLPPLAPETAAWLCRLTMMKLLPSLIEIDVTEFGSAVTEIQERLGDHFAPAQNGRRFVSPSVSEALAAFLDAGAAGVGQSSWGPTGFAIAGSEDEAKRLLDEVVMNCHSASHLKFLVTRGRNRGALITPPAGLASDRS
ncbi:4-diphosphocytidyl-2-C-methyl-D-erythritol kinase [Hartmannibacter diazotrophicus]|uniref:4-diphosphocytidyl-2-C-methyl-D-erythritol kinase n=1 Tax=Hartmannibacter diazotrophicus TaxID=1482074 RepID=A0A2C9D6N2_9HYPH|nr:beta-ribofuranosylaminobenzene 5'-phosphate synthase family protein [Hartmannibacter diazotrophicus]SON55850.1 4-diphosphocytidyl-2-C-methyl-D-erythritol kinase [Hartmannibacter diazotrophicus]